ncbi:hypothetical protein [Paraburkholderia acidipaludis]|nr:hypothetical protein [Paraburkholderia acidipaludis]
MAWFPAKKEAEQGVTIHPGRRRKGAARNDSLDFYGCVMRPDGRI